MLRRFSPAAASAIALLIAASSRAEAMPIDQDVSIEYRLERLADLKGFGGPQVELLEKLNRADARHLSRLPQLIQSSARWARRIRRHGFCRSTYASLCCLRSSR